MSEPTHRPLTKVQLAQTALGWVLLVLGALAAVITLFTFPFVLQEQGKEAVIEALYFVVPEAIVLMLGMWLVRRNRIVRN